MKPEEAIAILTEATGVVAATRDVHEKIQIALRVITELVAASEKSKDEPAN